MNQARSPFKFLDAYTQEDHAIFFGREQETEALYNALSGVKHLLVHGPSGTGKTSLIECGLRNQFSDADWYAITIRRGINMTASVFAKLNEALQEKITLHPVTGLPVDADTDFGQVIENLFVERYQPVYLLFDQFEELLISGSEAEKKDFFSRINRLIRYKVPCRALFIMREEFMGHLSEFEPLCPSIFQHRFRLDKMRKENVREVIRQTLDAPRYRKFFQVENSELLSDSILAKLPDKSREIELTHVQVFLSELWHRAANAAGSLPEGTMAGNGLLLHAGLVHDTDNLPGVLDSFLKNQLGELAETYGSKAPLETLAAMISERHTKIQLSVEDLQKKLKAHEVKLKHPLPKLLGELQQRRILRAIVSGEQQQFEISHDVLAHVVGQNLTQEMQLRDKAAEIYRVYEERKGFFSQDDLDHLRPYRQYKAYPTGLEQRVKESEVHLQEEYLQRQREKDAQLAAANRARKRNLVFALAVSLLAIVATGAAFFAFHLREEAKFQEEIAVREKEKSEILYQEMVRQMDTVEAQRIKADILKVEAEAQAEIAKNETARANKALGNLDRLSSKMVEINLDSLKKFIISMKYEAAEKKSKQLFTLGRNMPEVRQYLSESFDFNRYAQELAFFLAESGQSRNAERLLKQVFDFEGSRDKLPDFIVKIDPGNYDMLLKRYYPEMIPVKGGKFQFGKDSAWEKTETVGDISVGQTEVTFWQFALYCAANRIDIRSYIKPGWPLTGAHPIINVTWADAVDYTVWLNKAHPSSSFKYRLPTEVEWEYVARGGENFQNYKYSGGNTLDKVGNRNRKYTIPVKQKQANSLGIYDMSGNVWEWCQDWYVTLPNLFIDPAPPTKRVQRGGCYLTEARGHHVTFRGRDIPEKRVHRIGFRVFAQ